jgi:NAD(P)H-hydrate repair Nnr-like enzyme with NAD(P)H-hydrate dehydratase domain
VLLKGSGSVVVAPGRLPHVNPTGNAALASAGTGDVLAGWAAGLWAQQPRAAAFDVAVAAAWQHGRAADIHTAAGGADVLRAADLVEALARQAAA